MKAESRFNTWIPGRLSSAAPLLQVRAETERLPGNSDCPVIVKLTDLITGDTLVITMKEREAKALAAELYAISDPKIGY